MKRLKLALLLLAMAVLAGCGSKNDIAAQEEPAAQTAAVTVAQAEEADAAVPAEEVQVVSSADRSVDLDLTRMSGTVVYSQVYDMTVNPDAYMGQRVRVKGNFSCFQDPETGQEYFAAIIADATACCAQGIEFVWAGAHRYPDDYPPLNAEITVTGTFGTYYENDYMYIQLTDAELEAA